VDVGQVRLKVRVVCVSEVVGDDDVGRAQID